MEFINKENVIELLSKLVKIKSVYLDEDEIMEYVYELLKDSKIDAHIQNYSEEKILNYNGKNILGTIEGAEKGPVIYLNGHLDTVQITNGWDTDPLDPIIKGDKLYGVGTLDMKSGVVAIILALKEFQKNHEKFKGKILYSFVSDEEGPYGLGTDAVINAGFAKEADVAIITEPSSGFSDVKFPCLSLGARGGFSYKVEFFGKAAHGANPEKGISAILDASKFAIELKKVELPYEKMLGSGSNCVVEINGGGASCSVADYAYVKVFRHINMEENKETIIKEIENVINKIDIKSTYNIEFRKSPSKETEGFLSYLVDKEDKYVEKFISSIKNITEDELTINYFSSIGDFNYVGSRLDIPTIVFGASGENYHSPNEYVSIDSIIKTSEVVYDYFEKLLSI